MGDGQGLGVVLLAVGGIPSNVQVRPLAERYLGEGRDDLASIIWRGDCANETLTAD